MTSAVETTIQAATLSSAPIDFGIRYAPTTVSAGTIAADTILARMHPTSAVSGSGLSGSLEGLGVKFVRLQWVDLSNFVHCRVLTTSHFYKLLRASRPGVTIAKVVLGIVFLTMAEGFGATGEYVLVFDLASVRMCGYAPGHAAVFGYFQEKYPIGGRLDVPLCPRTNLRRLVKYAAEELKTEFLVGFETEFILLTTAKPAIQAPNNHGWSRTAAFASGTAELKVLEEIAEALATSGIELQMFHSEAAPGQYEVVTGPLPPLEAADALAHTRETIYNIASKHGMHATLTPRLYADSCGSGAHTHISVHPTTGSSPPSERHPSTLTTHESRFLAGLMAHLPSIIAFALPLPQSYSRMKDGIWSGGTWACWGDEHKDVSVRLTNSHSPQTRNFEVKTVDGTANPYLVLAGLISAGIIGIRDQLELTVEGCGETSGAGLSEAERAEKGITRRLPLDVESARQCLLEDQKIGELIGEEVVRKFVAVNKASQPQTLGRLIVQQETESEDAAVVRLVETY
ncbi:hypothetical protein EDD17DRAFT_1770051 [Pisolithus thermaeus]|nr:hypothetical protein EV401DRAFT_2202422 [Pisolithus croceorrhizus]KAI6140706.1 hypothetical protein EDD17DRAFT_1770051 [Pisolithus thermaeus]